jgi:hypothetical protein
LSLRVVGIFVLIPAGDRDPTRQQRRRCERDAARVSDVWISAGQHTDASSPVLLLLLEIGLYSTIPPHADPKVHTSLVCA